MGSDDDVSWYSEMLRQEDETKETSEEDTDASTIESRFLKPLIFILTSILWGLATFVIAFSFSPDREDSDFGNLVIYLLVTGGMSVFFTLGRIFLPTSRGHAQSEQEKAKARMSLEIETYFADLKAREGATTEWPSLTAGTEGAAL